MQKYPVRWHLAASKDSSELCYTTGAVGLIAGWVLCPGTFWMCLDFGASTHSSWELIMVPPPSTHTHRYTHTHTHIHTHIHTHTYKHTHTHTHVMSFNHALPALLSCRPDETDGSADGHAGTCHGRETKHETNLQGTCVASPLYMLTFLAQVCRSVQSTRELCSLVQDVTCILRKFFVLDVGRS